MTPPPFAAGPIQHGGYGGPPAGAVPQTNGKAVASLVLSLAGFVVCIIGSILGIVFGGQAKREIRESGGWQQGEGMAQAGQVLGWIGIGLSILLVVGLFGITFLGKAASSKFSSVGSAVDTYSQCDPAYSYDC